MGDRVARLVMGPFARRRNGLEMRLGEAEAEILTQVLREMRAQIAADERAPHLRRLYPDAYPEDPDAQAEFAGYTQDEMSAAKLASLDAVDRAMARGTVRRGLWTVTLEDEEVGSLLGALNDARLALGTRLNVTEDSEERPIDETAPDAPALSVYRWLGWLESFLVDELLV